MLTTVPIIEGEVQKENEGYLNQVKQMVPSEIGRGEIILKSQFIPD